MGSFRLNVSDLKSRLGDLGSIQLDAQTTWTRDLDTLITNSLWFSASRIKTAWGNAGNAAAMVRTQGRSADGRHRSTVTADLSALQSESYSAGATDLSATLLHTLPLASPAEWFRRLLHGTISPSTEPFYSGEWRVRGSGVRSGRASLDSINISGAILSTNSSTPPDPALGFWRAVAPLAIPWQLTVSNILSEEISIGSLVAAGSWTAPNLELSDLDVRLYDGSLRGSAALNVASRKAIAQLKGNFDYQRLAALLDRPVQKWLQQFTWDKPPFVEARLAVEVPRWTEQWDRPAQIPFTDFGNCGGLSWCGCLSRPDD